MGTGRPGRRSYSALQRDLLWQLEEAGAEDVPTVMNTLPVADDDLSFMRFERALTELVRADLVEFRRTLPAGRSGGAPISERLDAPEDLRTLVARGESMWVATSSAHGVEIVLTESGRDALTE